MKPISRIPHWGSLALLLLMTLVSWQLRFVEANVTYWRNEEPADLLDWRRHENALPPKLITTADGIRALEFTPVDKSQSMAIQTWPADGTESIKVRIRHRSSPPIIPHPGQETDPVSVSVSGLDENHHLILDRIGHIVVGNTSDSWKTTEAIMPLGRKSRSFSFAIVVRGREGALQISQIDIVRVKQAPWFPAVAAVLWLLWALWFYRAVRPYQARKIASLLTSLWLLGWGGYLVFPRTIDIPRPFFSQFWMSQKNESPQVAPIPRLNENAQPNQEKIGPPPAVKRPPTDQARRWFKSFGGGRFLMHFGVMGVFAGGLLLLLPTRKAWPYIVAMIVGIELLPAILINNADYKDLLDLLAYFIAVAIAIPTANRLRTFLPRFLDNTGSA